MQPQLPLAEYQLTYQLEQSLTLPAYSGGLWHSVFGLALRQLVCVTDLPQCEPCLFLHQCDYPYLFRGPTPPNTALMRKYPSIPLPHIVRFKATEGDCTLSAGQSLSVNMVLVGKANQRLPVVIKALSAAGQRGLGKRRVRGQLQQVTQISAQAAPKILLGDSVEPVEACVEMPIIPALPETLRWQWLTPYKPSGSAGRTFEFERMMMAVIRRISLLQYFYTGVQLEADFKQLKADAAQVQPEHTALHWQAYQRYSAVHGKSLDISGWLGAIELQPRAVQSLWPYLWLGQWLGVGKNASMGFGHYRLLDF